MIKIDNIRKFFTTGFIPKKVEVLKGFSITVQPGEVFGLLGPNGAGKTTTIKILMNLIMPTGGTAEIDGINVSDHQARRSVGYLPEQPYYYSYLTGREFLDYCGRLCDITGTVRGRRVDSLLDLVGLTEHAHKALGKYSRGMLQRIGVAQAMINDPKIFIFDEPLAGLDPIGRREILHIIFEQKKQGKTILFSSHILSDAESICDRVGILNDGLIIAEGQIHEILEKEYPRAEVEVDFTAGNNFSPDSVADFGVISTLRERTYRIKLADEKKLNTLLTVLIQSNAEIDSVNRHRISLEDLFLRKIA